MLRSALYDVFQAFDFPDPAVPNGDRATTTVASQALFMMNGPIVDAAPPSAWPRSLLERRARSSDRDRLERACRRILGRPAAPDEMSRMGGVPRALSGRAVAGRPRRPERRRRLAWQGLCRALLSSNEFIYVE